MYLNGKKAQKTEEYETAPRDQILALSRETAEEYHDALKKLAEGEEDHTSQNND